MMPLPQRYSLQAPAARLVCRSRRSTSLTEGPRWCATAWEVRLTAADVGHWVVVRWRRPAAAGTGDEVADVLGILEAADGTSFHVRRESGELVVIPLDQLAGKTVPPKPVRSSRRQHRRSDDMLCHVDGAMASHRVSMVL